jgi:hypothetical protein
MPISVSAAARTEDYASAVRRDNDQRLTLRGWWIYIARQRHWILTTSEASGPAECLGRPSGFRASCA